MKSLGGIVWSHNASAFDYPIVEAAECLKALCDKVVILDAGSTDGTYDIVKQLEDEKTIVVKCSTGEWRKQRGREKISFFQNLAMSFLTTDYYFCLQADEIIHESCFPKIREAIETGCEGFFVTRINLWGDTRHQLNVPQERKPVSTEVLRLAVIGSKSIDDGEGIFVNTPNVQFYKEIRIYHMGFVRENRKHIEKIKHIQGEVFEIEVDKRIEPMGKVFDPWVHFKREDVIPIGEELPIFIQKWAHERDEINSK